MRGFLSEENIEMHKEYARRLALRYSILEKSIEGIKGKRMAQILSTRHSRDETRDILSILPELELHEIYFSSFREEKHTSSHRARDIFGSEGALLNELFRLGMTLEYGFVTVVRRGMRIENFALNDYAAAFTLGIPILAIDVCEHAYFYDYRFDKRAYLVSALSFLDLSKLD